MPTTQIYRQAKGKIPPGEYQAGWVYADVDLTTNNNWILSKSGAAGNRGYVFYINYTTQKLSFQISNDGTATSNAIGNTSMTTGKWYFVAAVYNDTDLRLYLYCASGCPNGVDTAASTNPLTYSSGLYNTSAAFEIASNASTSGQYGWQGYIGDVAVWSRALSAAGIATVYGAGDDFSGL